jgi:hypothetical protein
MAILSKSEFPLPEVEQAEIIRIFIEVLCKGANNGFLRDRYFRAHTDSPPKNADELRSQWGMD